MIANSMRSSSSKKKSVLVISSQVVRGWVGGRSSVFVLERNGFPVWFLPTILLPWHPGHGQATKYTIAPDIFSKMVNELKNSKWFGEIGGILTGYMGNKEQVETIEQLIQVAKNEIPDLTYLCDPIIGDGSDENGALYVSTEIASAIRDRFLPLADIITPNLFELSWLANITFHPQMDCHAAFEKLGIPEILVTSLPSKKPNSIRNMLINQESSVEAEHEHFNHVPHGTGDLLAALTLSRMLVGMKGSELIQSVSDSVYEVIYESLKLSADELALESAQSALVNENT